MLNTYFTENLLGLKDAIIKKNTDFRRKTVYRLNDGTSSPLLSRLWSIYLKGA